MCSHSVFPRGWSDDGGFFRKAWRQWGAFEELKSLQCCAAALAPRGQLCCSLAGRGDVEAPSLVVLHVPDATHGLDLGLEGGEVVVVSVFTALKQVLVASVSRVLVTHKPEGHGEGESEFNESFFFFKYSC